MELKLNWNKEWNIPTIAAAVSFGIGGAIGYGISQYRTRTARKVLSTIHEVLEENEVLAEDEVDQPSLLELPEDWMAGFKATYPPKAVQVTQEQEIGPLEIPAEVYEQVANVSVEEEPEEVITVTVTEEGTEIVIGEPNSIWDREIDGWDYEEELAKRTSDAPYIIHKDEYDAEEAGYSQSTLTFYAGDSVLVDERDVPIYDAGKIVGEPIFGHGSQDPSICYIRNDRLEAEYEILLEEGFYQVEVLGAEIEHSYESRKEPLRKFRD